MLMHTCTCDKTRHTKLLKRDLSTQYDHRNTLVLKITKTRWKGALHADMTIILSYIKMKPMLWFLILRFITKPCVSTYQQLSQEFMGLCAMPIRIEFVLDTSWSSLWLLMPIRIEFVLDTSWSSLWLLEDQATRLQQAKCQLISTIRHVNQKAHVYSTCVPYT